VVCRLDKEAVSGSLRHAVSLLIRCMTDAPAVQRAVMRLVGHLLNATSPGALLSLLVDNLAHNSSRMRRAVVDVVIVSLLTHPAAQLDLPTLARIVATALVDGIKVCACGHKTIVYMNGTAEQTILRVKIYVSALSL